MIVENKELIEGLENKDWNNFFKKTYDIANYVLVKKFPNISRGKIETLKQEMAKKTWELILENKLKKDNIFSYLMQRYIFICRDFIRKETRRRKKVDFISLNHENIKNIYH